MSRAFVKELDDVEPLHIEPVEPRPMTPGGHAELLSLAASERDPERAAELRRRLERAIVIGPPANRGKVAFGASVRVAGAGKGASERTFTIVGEDEIDIEHGRIGESSPLAQALIGKKSGATAVWQRPVGNLKLTILGISFGDEPGGTARKGG